jgi:hypothetical protein
MVKKGLKLTKEQLYNINKPSLKDAILIFGGGCTGEVVSAEGLVFTNHHCGYDAIANASNMDHNYSAGWVLCPLVKGKRSPVLYPFSSLFVLMT